MSVDDAIVRRLAAETGLSLITTRILLSRGIDTPAGVRAFLEPSLERDWPATTDIPGMADAADRVVRAIEGGERIVVFGDFDLDGISAAATAALGLAALGATVDATVPHRFTEGYGLSEAALGRVIGMGPALVITVDCGISNAVEVEMLRAHGIDTVITDHHEPGPGVPVGVPVADPKLTEGAPPLAGAGVALA
ncbi:MAG: DHH family phosphoesterase, partial [Coriobacteriia bacterium]|nr:DHH family phosphoesterase [Coriobacteriia bacterium]